MDDSEIDAALQEEAELAAWEAQHAADLEAMEQEPDVAADLQESRHSPHLNKHTRARRLDFQDQDQPVGGNFDADLEAYNRMTDIEMERFIAEAMPSDKRRSVEEPEATVDEPMTITARRAKQLRGVELEASTSFLLDSPPDDVGCVTCTLSSGDRYFMRKEAMHIPKLADARDDGDLLGLSIEEMLKRVDQRILERAVRNAEAKAHEAEQHEVIDLPDSYLWVDKYAPQQFTALMSNEDINRNVLKWVSQWNPEHIHKMKNRQTQVSGGAFKGLTGATGRGRPGAAGPDAVVPSQQEQSQRLKPWEFNLRAPVLLLCGGPGLGKTTLAHVVAKHAGFNCIEINASDDRGGNNLISKIQSAMDMRTVFGSSRRNLVVVDEIDGAMSAHDRGMTELLAMIKATKTPGAPEEQAKKKSKYGHGDQGEDGNGNDDADDGTEETKGPGPAGAAGGGNNRRKKKVVRGLTAPVICICNDKYSPVLHELRSIAQVVEFKNTSAQRLQARLQAICQSERCTVAHDALMALCELTDNDIRSCLNTLQFLSVQHRGQTVTANHIAAQSVGHKDKAHGLFDAWQRIFMSPARIQRMQRQLLGRQQQTESSAQQIMSLCRQLHDHQRLVHGLYENYPHVDYIDPTLKTTGRALSWLAFAYDCVDKSAREQHFGLLEYVPAAVAGIHLACRADTRPRLNFPRIDGQLMREKEQHRHIMTTFLQQRVVGVLIGHTRCGTSTMSMRGAVLDLLSPLLTIISPKLKPVNLSMPTSQDSIALKQVVEIMVAAHLSLIPTSEASATNMDPLYILKPEIDLLVQRLQPQVDGVPILGHVAALDNTVRQIIGAKVRQRATQLEVSRNTAVAETPPTSSSVTASDMASPMRTTASSHALPQHVKDLITHGRADRFAKTPAAPAAQKAIDAEQKESPAMRAARLSATFLSVGASKPKVEEARQAAPKPMLTFEYMEGFTNAVRRPVKWRDLVNK